MTAYLDESGTHEDKAKVMVMGGFAGTCDQWSLFERKWTELKARYPELDGAPVHATDLMRFKNQYSHWSDEKQGEFVRLACGLVSDSGVYGIVVGLDTKAYSEHSATTKRVRLNVDTAYGACFRRCMVKLAVHTRTVYPSSRLSFVLENGHKNRGDADRIFQSTKRSHRYPLENCGGAGKSDYGALQAADLISYCTHKHLEQCLVKPPDSPTVFSYVVHHAACKQFLDARFSYMQTLSVLSFAELARRLPKNGEAGPVK